MGFPIQKLYDDVQIRINGNPLTDFFQKLFSIVITVTLLLSFT